MPVSRIITGGFGSDLGPGAHCRVTRMTLQEGLDILRWQSTFEQPVELPLQDDSECIHFSFTNLLKGKAACSFRDGRRQRRYVIDEGAGSISFGRCRHGLYHQHGEIDNITVMIRPELLAQWGIKARPAAEQGIGLRTLLPRRPSQR